MIDVSLTFAGVGTGIGLVLLTVYFPERGLQLEAYPDLRPARGVLVHIGRLRTQR